MKNTTLIIGNQGTNKSSLAKKIANNRNTVIINGDEIDNFLKIINRDTEVIIFEDVDSISISMLKLITTEKLIHIERPEIILVSNSICENEAKNLKHIDNIIKCIK